jgi:LysM repeat protein
MRALRSTLDRLFERLASRNLRAVLLAIAAPAITAGLVITVHSGDTLSGIAAKYCGGNAADWTGIYAANKSVVGGNPDLIYPGEKLTVTCTTAALPAPAAQPVLTSSANGPVVGSSDSGYAVTSSFQQCVIQRESGGDAQIWNASGHYGLYQFSYSTWTGVGGDPALFGKASAGYQTYVFGLAVRLDGTSDWAPYDGC